MPGAIRIVAVTTGAYTAIQPSCNTYSISVRENGSAAYPTTGFLVKKHLTGNEMSIPIGASYTFKASDGRRVFRSDAIRMNDGSGIPVEAVETIGYIKCVDANCDVAIDEEGL